MKLLCEVQDVARIVLDYYTTINKQFRVALTVKGGITKASKEVQWSWCSREVGA
jgi:hypothetical protein